MLVGDRHHTATVLSVDGIGAHDQVYRASMLTKLLDVPRLRRLFPFVRKSCGQHFGYIRPYGRQIVRCYPVLAAILVSPKIRFEVLHCDKTGCKSLDLDKVPQRFPSDAPHGAAMCCRLFSSCAATTIPSIAGLLVSSFGVPSFKDAAGTTHEPCLAHQLEHCPKKTCSWRRALEWAPSASWRTRPNS